MLKACHFANFLLFRKIAYKMEIIFNAKHIENDHANSTCCCMPVFYENFSTHRHENYGRAIFHHWLRHPYRMYSTGYGTVRCDKLSSRDIVTATRPWSQMSELHKLQKGQYWEKSFWELSSWLRITLSVSIIFGKKTDSRVLPDQNSIHWKYSILQFLRDCLYHHSDNLRVSTWQRKVISCPRNEEFCPIFQWQRWLNSCIISASNLF